MDAAPLALAPLREPLSPLPLESPCRSVVEVQLPFTPDTFAAARDLIAMTAPGSPPLHTKSLVPQQMAPSQGKLALIHLSTPLGKPWHCSESWHRSPSLC